MNLPPRLRTSPSLTQHKEKKNDKVLHIAYVKPIKETTPGINAWYLSGLKIILKEQFARRV